KYQLSRHKGVRHFDFTDSLVNADIKELSLFADLITREGLRITWAGQALIRPYMTPEVLKKLKKSGCICLAYGMESGSQKVLDLMRKGFKVEDAQRVIRDTHEAGIDTVANFMFGFPGEQEEDFKQTLEFVSRNRGYIDTVNPSLGLTAIGEGTYLYEHAKDYNVDLSAGYLLWRDLEGKNTYETRKGRYDAFCKLASSLGLKFSYQVNVNADVN
ncbi:MAG: radical SAM protein, partial [Candidatus Omnitrophica bacterium]|nr:radical SAM protein [Candidatus Omnitrophota bacterium]